MYLKFVRKGIVDEDLDVDADCDERFGRRFDFDFRRLPGCSEADDRR